MATKTISIDLQAYETLTRARREPRESFSNVIKRGRWPTQEKTAAAFLAREKALPYLTKTELDRLERAQTEDRTPEDSWKP